MSNLPIEVRSLDGGNLAFTDNPEYAVAMAIQALRGGSEKGITFLWRGKWITTVQTEVGARLALRLIQNAEVGVFSSDIEKHVN